METGRTFKYNSKIHSYLLTAVILFVPAFIVFVRLLDTSLAAGSGSLILASLFIGLVLLFVIFIGLFCFPLEVTLMENGLRYRILPGTYTIDYGDIKNIRSLTQSRIKLFAGDASRRDTPFRLIGVGGRIQRWLIITDALDDHDILLKEIEAALDRRGAGSF